MYKKKYAVIKILELLIKLIKLKSKLSIRAERQLYITYIISVSDYRLEI